MIKQAMRSTLVAILFCMTLLVATGFPRPQSGAPHPLEGLFEVSLARADNAGGLKFLLSLTRAGSKWTGEVREMPVPVTVKDITVTGDTSFTCTATVEAPGLTANITLKIEANKITCIVNDGDMTATLTATKKASEGKATPAPEGIYEAQAVREGGESLAFELVIKRMKSAQK